MKNKSSFTQVNSGFFSCASLDLEHSSLDSRLYGQTLISNPKGDQTNTFSKIENEEERKELIYFYKSRSEKVNVFEFFYTSNNHKVKGILVEPAKLGEPTSTVIYCRGGTGVAGSLKPMQSLSKHLEIFDLVNAGHIVIASQLSGVDGGEGMTDAGGQSDVDDVMNLYRTFQKYELSNEREP